MHRYLPSKEAYLFDRKLDLKLSPKISSISSYVYIYAANIHLSNLFLSLHLLLRHDDLCTHTEKRGRKNFS